jgi:hypothetical protein
LKVLLHNPRDDGIIDTNGLVGLREIRLCSIYARNLASTYSQQSHPKPHSKYSAILLIPSQQATLLSSSV